MAKLFAKFGTKRDENLGDLGDSTSALNFLLDGIKGGNESFTKDDLELIIDAYLTDITTSTFTSASGATVLQSSPGAPPLIYDPLITLQNRFDRAYFTTSEPFFRGGDGLTTRYFDSFQIERAVADNVEWDYYDPTSDFIGFSQTKDTNGRGTGGEIDKEIFWEEGDFTFGSKIRNKLLTAYGGAEWTGFFKTDESGNHQIRIYTRGFVRIEFDNRQAIDKDFTFDPITDTYKLNDLDFTENGLTTILDQTKLVNRGEIVSATVTTSTTNDSFAGANYGFLTPTSTSGSGTQAQILLQRDVFGKLFIAGDITTPGRLYDVGDTLTFSPSLFTDGSESSNVVLTITEVGGYEIYDSITDATTGIRFGDERTLLVNLGELTQWTPYKIRISYFIDDDSIKANNDNAVAKDIAFERITPSSSSIDEFNYKYLYNENYFDRYQLGDFKKFIDRSISLGGTNIDNKLTLGLKNPTATGTGKGDDYQKLVNLNPIISYYKSPIDKSISDLKQVRTGNISAGIGTIPLASFGSNRTEGIEVGNFVKGTGILIGSRVVSIVNNSSVKISPPPTSNTVGASLTFIAHKGLVAYGTNGSYTTNISSERGFSFGNRGISKINVYKGKINTTPNVDYGIFNVGNTGGNNLITDSSNGVNATFNISRNDFGSIVIEIVNAGSGYANGENFIIPGDAIENSFIEDGVEVFVDVVFEVQCLTDAYFTGKPEKVITSDQIFKSTSIPTDFTYVDKISDTINGITRTSNDSAIIGRVEYSITVGNTILDNAFIFKNTSISWPVNNTTDTDWYIYQSFGLNNDGLAGFCEGVTTKRILQKLTFNTAGGTYGAYTNPVLVNNVSGSGTGMTVKYRRDGSNLITTAWVVDPGTGYSSGDIISIPGSSPEVRFTVGYTDLSGQVTLRLEDSKGLTTGMYAHLFPAIRFQTAIVTGSNGDSVELLSSDVTITNIFNDFDDPAGATEITLTAAPGVNTNVLTSTINFVKSVITKVTFTPVGQPDNKEICFRPTDTSPPFNATSTGLATSRDVKCVIDFTGSTRVGGSPGTFNSDSTLVYKNLELRTYEALNPSGVPLANSTVKNAVVGTDTFNGKLPIQTPGGTYYILLGS
jgi:hypothetical protein